jgi:hypothetical protein
MICHDCDARRAAHVLIERYGADAAATAAAKADDSVDDNGRVHATWQLIVGAER